MQLLGEMVQVDANTLPLDKTHEYSGTLSQVSLTGFYFRGGTSNCPTNPVLKDPQNAASPLISSLSSLDEEAQIEFKNLIQDQIYDLHVAVDNGTNYAWETKGQSTDGTFSVSGLDRSKKYCYRVSTVDLC